MQAMLNQIQRTGPGMPPSAAGAAPAKASRLSYHHMLSLHLHCS